MMKIDVGMMKLHCKRKEMMSIVTIRRTFQKVVEYLFTGI